MTELTLTQQELSDCISGLYTHLHQTIEPMIELCKEQHSRSGLDYWLMSKSQSDALVAKLKTYQGT